TELGRALSQAGSWASSEAVRKVMQANRKRNTSPELRLRSALHRLGVRFRLNTKLQTQPPVLPDLVIAGRRVAVFLDGCFWHGCPVHGSRPATNQHYWIPKIERNIARDRIVDEAIGRIGWLAV